MSQFFLNLSKITQVLSPLRWHIKSAFSEREQDSLEILVAIYFYSSLTKVVTNRINFPHNLLCNGQTFKFTIDGTLFQNDPCCRPLTGTMYFKMCVEHHVATKLHASMNCFAVILASHTLKMRISYCGQMCQILWPNFHVLNLVLFIIASRSESLVGVICNRHNFN
jgi:hypothetical protein